MVKFIHLADSLHRRLFNKILHTSFLGIFLDNFSVNFQSSLPQMLNFILTYVCFVFEALFFKQHNGKVYSFNKVFTLVFFNKLLVNFLINYLVSEFYSFNKVFRPSFFNKVFTLVVLAYLVNFLVNFQFNLPQMFNFV